MQVLSEMLVCDKNLRLSPIQRFYVVCGLDVGGNRAYHVYEHNILLYYYSRVQKAVCKELCA